MAAMALARWISIVAHPFVMSGVLVGAAAVRLGAPGGAARAVGMVAAFALLPIAILMLVQVRRGSWDNVDASNAGERPVLFLVGGMALGGLLTYLSIRHPESLLLRGGAVVLGMLTTCAVLTRWIKVSLHMAFATLTVTSLLLIGSPVGWILCLVVPALAWARLALGRHTPWEVILGGLIGVAAGLVLQLL
jgi:hypothetical protein